MRIRGVLFPIALAGLAWAPAAAQSASPWDAWHGCWRQVDAPAAMVCVLPGSDALSVRIGTVEDGALAQERVVRADGEARPLEEEGCSGTQRAVPSRDGLRIYTKSELSCGAGLGRTVTGLFAMASEREWLDAEALTVSGQHASRVTRYQLVPPRDVPPAIAAQLPADRGLAQQTARLAASLPLDVDAVIEASGQVAPPVIEALLAAHRQGFGMNAGKLIRLRDGKVAESTIDLMVALSYPQRFQVAEAPQPRPAERVATVVDDEDDRWDREWECRRHASRWSYRPGCYDRYFFDPYYSSYGYGYGYGYGSRYGYGYNAPYYNPGPVVIIVDPQATDEGSGRLVRGQGYVPRGTASTGRSATPRSGSSGASVGSSSSGSSSGSASSSGSSGSSSTPVRKAKPRGAGGGGI